MAILSHIDIGVDVSKKHLDIYLHQEKKAFHVPNTVEGINKFISSIKQYNVRQIVCESTGGYEYLMCKMLKNSGYKVWRVEPKRIKAFIVSEGVKAKTDKIDAKMIALFASQKECAYESIQQSDDNEKLRSLVSLRASMTTHAAEIKTQLQQVVDPDCIKYLNKNLCTLEKQIKKISEQIDALINDNNEFKNIKEIVTSIPGIGKGNAEMFIALLPEFGKVNNKEAAALVGVAPYIRQSGCLSGQAKISGGRAPLRSVLYMAAVSAIKHNTRLAVFYQRLITAGKKFKVAIVAVMRKLVVYMNTLVRKGELWDPAII